MCDMSGEGARFAAGFALCILAGVCNGSWQLPLKTRAPAIVRIVEGPGSGWQFENAWLLYTSLSILFELIIAFSVLGAAELSAIYAAASPSTLVLIIVFSALWGFGSIGFGVAVQMLGIAIGTSLCIGVVMVLGTLLPLLVNNLDEAGSHAFALTIAGAFVGTVGFALSAAAGSCDPKSRSHDGGNEGDDDNLNSNKDKCAGDVGEVPPATTAWFAAMVGVCVAIVGGVLASQLQFAFVFGQAAITAALRRGHHPIAASQAVWLFAFTMGGAVNVAYAVVELTRNQTWSRFLPQTAVTYAPAAAAAHTSGAAGVGAVGGGEGKEIDAVQRCDESDAVEAPPLAEEHRDIDVADKPPPHQHHLQPEAGAESHSPPHAEGCSYSCSHSYSYSYSYTLRNCIRALWMALLWMAHITIYGYSQSLMGRLGAGIAWPLIMISTVSTGQFWSWALGEWQDLSAQALRFNAASILTQFAAVLIIAIGNSV